MLIHFVDHCTTPLVFCCSLRPFAVGLPVFGKVSFLAPLFFTGVSPSCVILKHYVGVLVSVNVAPSTEIESRR
jgi:hypothetical protein